MNQKEKYRLLVFGAHPDDCDIKAGGLAALYSRKGHQVKFVSVTNGDAGHHQMGGACLALRRQAEAQAAANILGIEYELLDNHDGQLEPRLENRLQIISQIRQFQPDLVMTHRPNDYHPDHRYTSILVQDAAYMVTVPNVCGLVPILNYNPTILYLSDGFKKPYAFQADVVIGIDKVIDQKLDMMHCHQSQFYEWLPYNAGTLDQVPSSEVERRQWLANQRLKGFEQIAEQYRHVLISTYGEEKGRQIRYAEAFEACEYGSPLTSEKKQKMLLDFCF